MTYFDELKLAAEKMALDKRVVFVGQAVAYPGTGVTRQLADICPSKKLEMIVAEELQAGMCLGLALEGFVPVCIYPRWNFALLAANQIVNHIDKFEDMCRLKTKFPKVIIKVVVGSVNPLDPGFQHKADFTQAFDRMCEHIVIEDLRDAGDIADVYQFALEDQNCHIIVEHADLYAKG